MTELINPWPALPQKDLHVFIVKQHKFLALPVTVVQR